MEKIRTLIIDDEANARSVIRNMLAQLQLPVEVVGEAGSAAEGMEKIRELQPKLLFLDIQMPGKSGIELSADDAVDFFATAGATMARAISRGIHAATPAEGDLFPVWSSR